MAVALYSAFPMTDAQFHRAAALDDIEDGSVTRMTLAGRDILLCQTKGEVFAVANRCSHADESLECGRMRSGWIACPAHGARFELATGRPMNPPATEPIETFETRVVDGVLEVKI